jgi:hypothetical protein
MLGQDGVLLTYKPQLKDDEPFDTPAVRAAQGERTFHPAGDS